MTNQIEHGHGFVPTKKIIDDINYLANLSPEKQAETIGNMDPDKAKEILSLLEVLKGVGYKDDTKK